MSEKLKGTKVEMPDGRTSTWRVDPDWIFDKDGAASEPTAYLYCDCCHKRVDSEETSCTCPS